jgi:PAS domain S-box-containing protein
MPSKSVVGSNGDGPDRGFEARVLLVDDDELIREAYARFLGKLGCVVETAASGASALEILRAARFDLIVSDINMAGMSGLQLLRAVREHNLDVPVILMTGAGMETTREAVDYVAFRFLVKPIAFTTFAQTVNAAIHMHVVARILAERVPFLAACRRIVQATCQGGAWDFATIWVPGDGNHMRCAETWARPGYDVAAFESTTRTLEVEVESAFVRKGWTCGSPDWIPDISAESNVPRVPFAIAAGFQSGFSVPIGAEGEIFAVLEFFSRRHRGPDLALLEMFATTGAQLSAQLLRERAELRATLAETAHKAVRVTLDTILECAPAFIMAVDQDGSVQFINKVPAHLKLDDAIGSDLTQDLAGALERDDQHQARLRRILATGVAETYETTVVGTDGRALSFATNIGPLRVDDLVAGAVLVTQDVTELKRT